MLKILVVDDNPALAHAIANILDELDVTVEVDPAAALERVVDAEVDGEPYDMIVCDAVMSGTTGLDLLAAARSLYQPPQFILLSGEPELADAGADAVLLKPFTPQELRALITCLVAARQTATTRPLRRYLG